MLMESLGQEQSQESIYRVDRILRLKNAATQLELLINKMRGQDVARELELQREKANGLTSRNVN